MALYGRPCRDCGQPIGANEDCSRCRGAQQREAEQLDQRRAKAAERRATEPAPAPRGRLGVRQGHGASIRGYGRVKL